MSVADRLKHVHDRIAAACARAGRDPRAVGIVAVSKKQPLYKIREAYECGQLHFGENYVQEAAEKMEQLQNLPVHWHFIGRIQSNKTRLLAGHFHAIHSIERASVADALNRFTAQLNPPTVQRVYLQFNVAQESSKGGADEIELENLVNFMSGLQNLSAMGVMVMPPAVANAEAVRPYFARAREFLERMRSHLPADVLRRHPLNELSMGTSQDFEVAIEEGATWIRIGSDIFGPREEH